MINRNSISQIILWLFVIVLGILIGGGVYEGRVLVPLWSASPPESVIAFYQHNVANPQFVPNQGGRFWMFVTPLCAILTIALLVSAIWTSGDHRKWRIAAGLCSLIAFAATFFWFVPNIIKLGSAQVLTMNGDELASLANAWVRLSWVRAAVLMTAWLAALRAMTVPTIEGE